ncbi:hypothetical protein ACJJTC_006531 [Scirpophaga incertulas]
MSSSPFPYTCELCGAEGLTDEGMRTHTLEAHVAGRPECPFCDCAAPPPQLLGHVQRAHLHYLTPERELMAFIDDQSPSFDEDSKMTTTDSCSYNTPGSINGWHSPDTSSSYHNGAISKNISYQNGFQDRDSYRNEKETYRNEKDDDRCSRSPKNINLANGLKNISISNGVIPKKVQSRQNSNDSDLLNGHERKGAHSSPSHNSSNSHESSPNKNKLTMASAGQGSPLRSQLALKLKPNTPKKSIPTPSPVVQCLLCDFTSTCSRKLEEHINRAHFDLTSPSLLGNANANSENPTLGLTNTTITLDNPTLALSAMAMTPGPHGSTYTCPICEREFSNVSEVEIHVNVEHKDILSPQKSDQMDNASCEDVVMLEESPVSNCPVCCQPLPLSEHELIQHIEEHFERGEERGAMALTAAEKEAQRNREEQEFQLLRAQYGMEEDEEGYTNRATNSLKRAVYSGALSVAGYYERSVGLRRAAALGRDAGASRTTGILERIAQLNSQNGNIVKTYLCSGVDHFASTYGDRGWGCGYRNMQMLLSALVQHAPYAELVGAAVGGAGAGGAGAGVAAEGGGVPSIPRLQRLVERAWQMGIDTQGSEQLGSKLHNTRKWIGACEVVTVLSPSGLNASWWTSTSQPGRTAATQHCSNGSFGTSRKIPTGLRHLCICSIRGHSRTIIGYEKHKDGKETLLVLDPSHSPAQVRQVIWVMRRRATQRCVCCGEGPVRCVRDSTSCWPSPGPWPAAASTRCVCVRQYRCWPRQYQLLAVTGPMAGRREYEVRVCATVPLLAATVPAAGRHRAHGRPPRVRGACVCDSTAAGRDSTSCWPSPGPWPAAASTRCVCVRQYRCWPRQYQLLAVTGPMAGRREYEVRVCATVPLLAATVPAAGRHRAHGRPPRVRGACVCDSTAAGRDSTSCWPSPGPWPAAASTRCVCVRQYRCWPRQYQLLAVTGPMAGQYEVYVPV